MVEISKQLQFQRLVGGDAAAEALSLTVRDPEVLAALRARAEGTERDEFALTALRIGVLALRQAQGSVDSDTLRNEGDRLVGDMEARLQAHHEAVGQHVATVLKEYFDPGSGRLTERLERLVKKDGELEQVLRRQIGADDSEMARTLASHLGGDSPIMRQLSPDEASGVVKTLAASVEEALGAQRERLLEQFSLDNKDGALSRLVGELTERHGKLSEGLQERIDTVVGEFSLDNADGALSRLVGRVETAQKQITKEFTLDEENSALARMRREFLDVLAQHRREDTEFREEVMGALKAMSARREESLRSTTHGLDFEAAVGDVVMRDAAGNGDVATATGNQTGTIPNDKKGDFVVQLGPDAAAAGVRIVVEAKQDASYDLAKARAELQVARKNRGAAVGVFVFSSRAAPAGLPPFARYGNDVVVVWDAEDRTTDVYFCAALSVARALCTTDAAARAERAADLDAVEGAIRRIEKQAKGLEEIKTWATTIQSSSEKILAKTRIMRTRIAKQIDTLDEHIEALAQ